MRPIKALLSLLLFTVLAGSVIAHPLGNFTINHFTSIQVGSDRVTIRYIVDMAEIPAFQEFQSVDTNGDGTTSSIELTAYAERRAAEFAEGLIVVVNGARIKLQPVSTKAMAPAGAGGLKTLRLEYDFSGELRSSATAPSWLKFENVNYSERAGWREVVVNPDSGVAVFNSTAYASGITDEIKAYPDDLLAAPLDERAVELSFSRGEAPQGSISLLARDGKPSAQSRDRLADLIAVPEVTPGIALLGLLMAAALGSLHALSPGHGKAVVGAYLVGSRGTARHAAFLGLTVTITHTLGVFALGVITLFASQYMVPEQLYPVLSVISGAIVLFIGLSLFVRRLRGAFNNHDHMHSHEHGEHADSAHTHSHDGLAEHSHDGKAHSHLPPGADGSRVTWRSLLALGISGGLLPCPSALVVLLSAISLHRVGYGLILVVAFSVGLAATLTAVGLAFVYLGRFMKNRISGNRLIRVLPTASAFIIACAGAAICYEALQSAGINPGSLFSSFLSYSDETIAAGHPVSTASILLLGLVVGLKHAVEADHLAAVTAIVSERKSLMSSTLVGGLWGIGHTISLLIAGLFVLLLQIKIPEKLALGFEFGVAIMLILLGANAIRRVAGSEKVHTHKHGHGAHEHLHPHIHDHRTDKEDASHHASHHGLSLNSRPLLVGMVHGLAGSAALMLLILSTISSPVTGMAYIAVFGLGSVGGMLVMSALVSLPAQFTAARFARVNLGVRVLAGIFSIGIGLFMAYEIGYIDGLFR